MKNLLLRISLIVLASSTTALLMAEFVVQDVQLELDLAQSQLMTANYRVKWLENRVDELSEKVILKDESLNKLKNSPKTWGDFEYLAGQNQAFFYFVFGAGILIGLLVALLIAVLYTRKCKRELEKLKYHNARSLNLRNEQIEGLTKELTELQEAYELVA